MILTCPQCATRYQTEAAAFMPAGRKVRCAKCAHVWHQDPPLPEPEPEIEIPPASEPHPAARPAPPPRASAYAPPMPEETNFEAPVVKRAFPLDRLALAGGWIGLAAAVLLIAWAAVTYRQPIATLWPQSSSLYSALGMKVNARGLAFEDVSRRYESEDDQTVLAVSGNIVNVSGRELPVPQVRVILTSNDKRELYHWNFTPDAATLRPGQRVKFLTRLSNPPDGARNLELRLAQEGG